MANPFEDLVSPGTVTADDSNFPDWTASPFVKFGPEGGTNMEAGGGTAYTSGPEMLPWGIQAMEQDRPLERLATDPTQGQTSGQVVNPTDFRGQPQNPFAATPRAAASEGTIMGFIDHLRGVPTREQVAYGVDERNRQNENQATTAVLRRMMQIRDDNPGITPQQLAQRIYKDPVFLDNAMKHSPQEMSEFIGKVQEQLYGTQDATKLQGFAPGSQIVSGLDANGRANVVGTVPDRVKPEPKQAEIVVGGTPQAEKYGLNGIAKPGERVQVKFRRTPDGQDIPDSYSLLDHANVNIDLGALANKDVLNDVMKKTGDIRTQQGHVLNAAMTVDRLIKDLDAQGGAQNLGPVGWLNRITNATLEQANALSSAFGVTLDPKAYPALDAILKSKAFEQAGINSTVIQSKIIGLAFELAAAQNRSGNITQRDVNSAIEQIGASMGSAAHTKAALTDIVRRSAQRLDAMTDIQRDAMLDAEGKPLLPGRLPRRMDDWLIEKGLGRFTYSTADKEQAAKDKATEQAVTNTITGEVSDEVRDSSGTVWVYKGSGDRGDKKNYKKKVVRGSSGIATEEPPTGPKVPR